MSQNTNSHKDIALRIISEMKPNLSKLEELLMNGNEELQCGEINAFIQRISQIRPLYYTCLITPVQSSKNTDK